MYAGCIHTYLLARSIQLASLHDITGDEQRQAVDSIRGYVYQIYLSALAWIGISANEVLHLEVAEDFALSSPSELVASQVKATSKSITINDAGVKDAIDAFFKLTAENPGKAISLRFLTTSTISKEQRLKDRIDNEACLIYWSKAAEESDVSPIRSRILALKLNPLSLRELERLSDEEFRENFLKRISWDAQQEGLESLFDRLLDSVLRLGSDRRISASSMAKCLAPIIAKVVSTCTNKSDRQLSLTDLEILIAESTSISVPIDQHVQTQALLQQLLLERGIGNSTPFAPPTKNDIFRPIAGKVGQLFIAPRASLQAAVKNRLEADHGAWLHAGSGFGKSTLARLTAQAIGGSWQAINLRGIGKDEATDLLYTAAKALVSRNLTGVVLDDPEHFESTGFVEALEAFTHSTRLNSTLMIATSYQRPSEAVMAAIGLGVATNLQVPELNETDVAQIVEGLGGDPGQWARYVYLASGSGHPQLVQALSRNLASRNWPFSELQDFNALLGKNSEITKVRQETRKRLVTSMDAEPLNLLTRLTLVPGKFDREMVLQMGDGDPPIANAGLAFDSLIGPWIDETYEGVYQVSPLVSDLAITTFSETVRQNWQRGIARAITSGRSLDAGKMNAALLMAMATRENSVLTKIAVATIQLNEEELELLANAFFVLQGMSTDKPLVEDDPYINVIMRLAQFVLIGVEKRKSPEKLLAVWNALTSELKATQHSRGGELLELLVLSKGLSKADPGFQVPNYFQRLSKIYEITSTSAMREVRDLATVHRDSREMSALGLMLIMHLQALTKIEETLSLFEEINVAPVQLREQLLAPIPEPDLSADMYLSAAWLKEHAAGTIDPVPHQEAYGRIAELARGWGQMELAIAAVKYRAVVMDEYGDDAASALRVITEARSWAGDGFELKRAEAKILYRGKRFSDALPLYQDLIDAGGGKSKVEDAFMGREAGICAAETDEWLLAAELYEIARNWALQSDLRSMTIMATGLIGDSAVACWQAGNLKEFFTRFTVGLTELESIEARETLTARHVHAVYRHTLLWAENQRTGKILIGDGSYPAMVSGSISNPEPSRDIEDRQILNLEIAWYMLAALQVECGFGPSIADELVTRLGDKRLFSGEIILNGRSLEFYRKEKETSHFVDAARLRSELSIISKYDISRVSRDLTLGDYFEFRDLSDSEREEYFATFQIIIVTFAIELLATNDPVKVLSLFQVVADNPSFASAGFVQAVKTGSGEQPNLSCLLVLKMREACLLLDNLSPDRRLHLHILIVQFANSMAVPAQTIEPLALWMKNEWLRVIHAQGFLLRSPGLFANHMNSMVVGAEAPLSTAARVIQVAIAHVPVQVHHTFLTMLSEFAKRA